jgi:hypothetical protein
VIVAAAILHAGVEWLWEYTVNIVGSIGLSIANEIVSSSTGGGYSQASDNLFSEQNTVNTISGGACSSSYVPSGEKFGFGYIIDSIARLLQTLNCSLMDLMASGVLLFNFSFIEVGAISGCTWPSIPTLMAGLAMMFFSLLLLIRAPLKLVDGMFQLVISAAALPLGVVAWAFPSTRKYAANLFNLMLGALGLFVCMGIMLAIISHVLQLVLAIGGEQDDVTTWAKSFSWASFDGDNPNIFMAIGVMWLCYQGLGTVGELNKKLFSEVLGVGVGKRGDKIAEYMTDRAGQYAGQAVINAGKTAKGMGGALLNRWRNRNRGTQASSPAPPVRNYRDDRRAEKNAEARIRREEKRRGRQLTASERLEIQEDEKRRLAAANKRLHDRNSGVNEAQIAAQRANERIASRERRLGRKLTANERQGVFDLIESTRAFDKITRREAELGRALTPEEQEEIKGGLDFRKRYNEHYTADRKRWQDGGHGLGRPDTVSVADAQAEAQQTEKLIAAREGLLGRKLTAAERQEEFDRVSEVAKARGKTDADMDYRARYAEEIGDPDPNDGSSGGGNP